jgi:hypothetical protein
MRIVLSLVAAAAFCASPAAAGDDDRGGLVGRLFCQMRSEGEPAIRYLLTRSLTAEIDRALDKNEAIAAARPDEKPPLGDGVPFQAYQDFAPECRVAQVATADGGFNVDVEHVFADQPAGNWTDRLVIVTEDGLAKIDDILYGPEKFETGLRDVLATAFRRQ